LGSRSRGRREPALSPFCFNSTVMTGGMRAWDGSDETGLG
jgi:hypothetical protein